MGTTLHTLAPNPGANRKKKRLGRGRGSGTGKTSGKGVKGQKARSAHHGARWGFEGGQMPLVRRLPKRGFTNPFRVEVFGINVETLEKHFDAGASIDIDALREKGLVPKNAELVKILGEGTLTKKLTVKVHKFSKTALEKLAAAGGSAEVLPTKDAPAAATAD
jgi:large subunit ribosomal protein L15